MENIKISVSESDKDSAQSIVRVDGVIDTLTATQLEEVLEKLLLRSRHKIVLDLAGVDYISSAGWGIFISRIKEIRDHEGDIKLANMVPNVYEIYELLEFDNILNAYESVTAAKIAFGTNVTAGSKKKVKVTATQTTIEELPFGIENVGSGNNRERRRIVTRDNSYLTPGDIILDAIGQDPFYTISELKMIVREKLLDRSYGWWYIFKFLWNKKLLSRRARFRYARRRQFK